VIEIIGAPEGIRTPDPQIRSLYQVIDIIEVGEKILLSAYFAVWASFLINQEVR
jgi:hypothetical protein